MDQRPIRHCFAIAFLLSVLLAAGAGAVGAAQTLSVWSDVSATSIPSLGERFITPQHFRTVELDRGVLAAWLAAVPMEYTPQAAQRPVLDLPMPDGTMARFAIVESPCMEAPLQAKYPYIRTYSGIGLDDPTATMRMDLTQVAFHAMILGAGGTVYIDPWQEGDDLHYQSYYWRDDQRDKTLGGCTLLDPDNMAGEIARLVANGEGGPRTGGTLRTYRLALACTGEYASTCGGTVPLALASMTTSLNRVNGCYEKDCSIHMNLVANDDLLVFLNAATDPYTNNNGGAMLGQNQVTCDNIIGSANYDIGHVFSTGGGGVAYLGVVCRNGQKAGGVTGSPNPHGDGFDIDYVAHEMGHQFGGNHNFNSVSGSCGGGNRNAGTAYEVGSASTIMGYAGICAPDNLQPHSDDYFGWESLQEIFAYSQNSYGNNCPVRTSTGVVEPVITMPPSATIPINTPFILDCTATTTGTPTYSWEESDLGPAGHPNSPTGNAPIIRPWDPLTVSSRMVPRIPELLNNTHPFGELLPSYARTLSFRMTVRDFQAGGVGTVFSAPVVYTVAGTAPFQVTQPNTAVNWDGGGVETVTWDVVGTNAAPYNVPTVNILLSTDGGYTWPFTLAAATANDGTEDVTLPSLNSTTARVKVEAIGNIFFDLSNVNFTITDVTAAPPAIVQHGGLILEGARPNPTGAGTAIGFQLPQAGPATLRVFDPAGRLVRTLAEGQMGAGRHEVRWDGNDDHGRAVGSGTYVYQLNVGGVTRSGRTTIVR